MLSFGRQELDVHLDMAAGNLSVNSLGVHLPQAGTARQPVDAIALEHPGDRCIRGFDAMVSPRQIPDDPHWAEVVLASKIEDLLLDLNRYSIGVPPWNWWPVHQSGIAMLPIGP